MKILFNVQSLLPPRTGIGLYTQHLIEALAATGELDAVAGFLGGRIYRGEALHAYVNEDRSAHAAPALSRRGRLAALKVAMRGVPGAYAVRQALREWQDGRRIGVLASEGYVYHEPNYIPVRYAGPLVITAHDLSHVHYPQFHPAERVAFLNKHLTSALARAGRVVTDSHFVAGELAEVYGIPAGKLFVTHLGADADFRVRTSEEVTETLKAFGLRYRSFVLSVATLEPRKNVERLVAAYADLPAATRQACPLVLVGGSGWRDSTLLSRVRELEAKGEVVRTGYLPRSQVFDLYSAAAVFAYPSLYEGFGLPVLEAFASGTPVLTSNVTSLPEVSAGAALEVDPLSTEAIREGLYRLLDDAQLARQHAELGLERAKAFSWEKCAQQTLAVYRSLS